MPWWGPEGWGPWWIFPILMPIVMVVVLLIVLTMFREFFWGPVTWRGRRPYGEESSANSPLEILRRRFAKGEITEQEFEEKRKFLERS